MNSNLGFFVTHHIHLTKEQTERLFSEGGLICEGHSVPVWIDAKNGKTTEPAKEVFCFYELFGKNEGPGKVEPNKMSGGYSIWLPNANEWSPPDALDFEALSRMEQEQRDKILKQRDVWWFNNPKPPDMSNIKRGYLRFECKIKNLNIGKRNYSAQHVVEISSIERLLSSLTS